MATGREPVVLSWSGGKDSAMALLELREDHRYTVIALLTSFSSVYRRVSHHGVREELLEMQAAAVGLPLHKLELPSRAGAPCTHEEYEELLGRRMRAYRDAGVRLVAHGDIFLEALRARREENLAKLGMRGLFPIWGRDTAELLRRFIDLGFRAYLTCVESVLGARFAGRPIDADLARDLPAGVDPCGEHGEYHSFVWDGPIFRRPLDVRVGEIVERDTRFYADLLPGSLGAGPAVPLPRPEHERP